MDRIVPKTDQSDRNWSQTAGLALFLSILLVSFSLLSLVYRFRLPTDGWFISEVTDAGETGTVFSANVMGFPSGLQVDDTVVIMQAVFLNLTGQASSAAVVLSTLVIAALFTPLRRRIQDIINKRFFRQRYDANFILSGFSTRLQNNVGLDTVQTDLLTAVQDTLQPETLHLWLRRQ